MFASSFEHILESNMENLTCDTRRSVTVHLLGDILTSMDIISQAQLNEALEFQQDFVKNKKSLSDTDEAQLFLKTGFPKLGEILLFKKFINKTQLSPALTLQTKRAKDLSGLDSKKLATALELGFLINSTLDLSEVLFLIMKFANLVTASVASTLMLYDEKTKELTFSTPTGPKAEEIKDIRIPMGTGIAGWVAQQEEYVLVKDTSKDSRFYPGIDSITGCRTKSLLCVPMKSKTKLIGVLEVLNKNKGSFFTPNDALLLSLFAHQAAIAIENARLFSALEEQLENEQALKERMVNTEKIHVIGTLAGGIAHDFNNILSGIFGYSYLAKNTLKEPEIAEKYIEQVLRGAQQAGELVRQILVVNGKSDHCKHPLSISFIVKEALQFIRATIPATIQIKESIASKAKVMADPTKIHQVVMNLCTNAYCAMKNTGGILMVCLNEVELRQKDIPPGSAIEPGKSLKLEISDTGHGMESETMDKIFEPYFTTKDDGRGTGLGLAIVNGIVQEHKGHINVYSDPGKGTTVHVFFPITKKTAQPCAKEKLKEVPTGTEKIMFVDDEESIRKAFKAILNHLGYRVSSFDNGESALKAFIETPHQFDLIITDMTMPRMTGDILSKEILKIREDIPIILCTGFHQTFTEEKAVKVGIKKYIQKPVMVMELAKDIRDLLDTG